MNNFMLGLPLCVTKGTEGVYGFSTIITFSSRTEFVFHSDMTNCVFVLLTTKTREKKLVKERRFIDATISDNKNWLNNIKHKLYNVQSLLIKKYMFGQIIMTQLWCIVDYFPITEV